MKNNEIRRGRPRVRMSKRELINDCKHILLSLYLNDIYEQQKESLIKYYGEDIFKRADKEIKDSRAFYLLYEV